MSHWINVTEAVRTALAAQLSQVVERRYTAYYDPEDLRDGRIVVIGAAEDLDAKRSVDFLEIGVDVGFQRALPAASQAYPDPRNNLPFLDACNQQVSAIKSLFSGDGPLREHDFAGATFLRWRNDPLYRPDILIDRLIFTSVTRFEFRIED